MASLLLLVAAIGAVVLARRRRGLEDPDDEEFELRIHAPRSAYTGTMAEGAGVRQAVAAVEPSPEPVAEVVGRRSFDDEPR